MRSWLAKLKVSLVLDRGAVRSKKQGPEEIRRFEETMRAVDGRLRTERSEASVPPTLHASIMRAVSASRSQRPSLSEYVLRWLPVPALALLLVTGIWWAASNRSGHEAATTDFVTSARPLPGVVAAWEEGRELTQTATFAVMAPLSGEMELLNRDFQRAVTFLADSLP